MASLYKIILFTVLGLALASCGGGGSGEGTILTGGAAVPGQDDGPTFVVSISMTPVNLDHETPGVAVVTVTDGGNAVEEAVVTFSASVGTLTPNEGVIFTDSEGQATVNLTVPRASTTGSISAEVSVGNDTIVSESITYIVAFDPPTLGLELLDGSGNPTNDLTGFEQASVIVTLANEDGPIAGEIVTLTTGAGTVLGQASGLTDENGQVTTTLTAQDISAAGTLQASTTLDLTTVSTSVNYRVNEQAPGIGSVNLQFGVDQFTIAPLTQSTARIVVTQNDADNTPVEGAVVNFSANLVELIPASGSVFTDENGVAEVQIVAGSVPGNTQIEVEVIVGEESFNAPPINLIVAEALIEISLSDNVVEANEVIEVTAVLREATEEGRPIADTVIQLSTDIGNFATDSGLTDENGTIVLEMTGGTEAGEGTVVASASVAGNEVTGSANFQNVGEQASGDNRLELAASGMVDSFGNADSVLAGNETATVTVTVTEDGELADGISVLFETNQGVLSSASATTVNGVATVGLTGEGTAGVAIVDASANLSNGLQVAGSVTIATSSEQPTLRLIDAADAEIDSVELSAAESVTITALAQDWNGDRIEDLGIILAASAVAQDVSSGKTVNGEVDVVLTGLQQPGTGTLVATATFGSFNLTDQIVTTSLGVNPASDNISIQEAALDAALGANTALDGNEKVTVTAVVTEGGAVREGITVLFTTTGGALDFDDQGVALLTNSGVTDATGSASVQLIGVGQAGTADITAAATLGNGIAVTHTVTVQTTAVRPTVDLVVRDAAGVIIDTFGANQEVTLEATILDYDGADLSGGDQGQNVTFTILNTQLGTFSPGGTTSAQDVSETSACPVNGVKATPDCSVATLVSSANSSVGDLRVDVTVNGNAIFDIETVTNTGVNSGSPDQNSFSISREGEPNNDTVAVEGERYDNQEKRIRVDLADFFNNPVPDGTLVEFTTELGDVTPSCSTASGACEVTFTSGEPRSPDNSEVNFKSTAVDGCPSPHVADEIVTTASVGGVVLGQTDYRVKDILRVVQTGGDGTVDFNVDTAVLVEGVNYNIIADGIECITCPVGTELGITYRRLWLDEEDDGSTAHVLLTPGVATEPFLPTFPTSLNRGIPCLAQPRDKIEEITGDINPDGTTTVTGVGTLFKRELAVGDKIKVSGEVRTVTVITSDTVLTVDSAFSDNLNDITPERIIAPAYGYIQDEVLFRRPAGMGQPYGGRSTIIAYAVGEESFIDTNGNEEYDFGETFFDQGEAFLDKNEDGVLGDRQGDSNVAATVGPYRDAGLGAAPAGDARDKSNPNCYGPETIVEFNDGVNDSTEAEEYCYQDGGEEEIFFDYDGDGLYDIGNGIYNGSRCLTPFQDTDNDGVADATVCTTDLINISRSVQILMADSFAVGSFRACQDRFNCTRDDDRGGSNRGGEIINQVVAQGGQNLGEQVTDPGLSDSTNYTVGASGTMEGGVLTINAPAVPETLLTQTGVFQAGRTHTIDVDVSAYTSGSFDIQAGGVTAVTCNSAGACFTAGVTDEGDLTFVSTGGFVGTIDSISVTATTTGQTLQFALPTGTVASNDNTTALTEFDIGDTIDNQTVFAGVSERLSTALTTTNSFVYFWVTDKFNGQLPDGTIINVESDNETGCGLTSVAGIDVTAPDEPGGAHSQSVTVGENASILVTIGLEAGFGPGSSVTVTTTTPDPLNNVTTYSFVCSL